MSTTLTHPLSPGTMIRIESGYYLVEQSTSDLPPGFILARHAERPMTHAHPIRVEHVLEIVTNPRVE